MVRTAKTDTFYYMYNGHGDVTALTDANGKIRATYYYDAFGTPDATGTRYYDASGTEVKEAVNNTITFAGYQYDSATELYYLNARYYDSKIARFMSEDTYTGQKNDPLSLNLYSYCHNEPIMYTDPTGHWNELHDKQTVKITKTEKKVVNGKTKIVKTVEIKEVGTRVWATQEMNKHIENEAKNIPPEVKYKNGKPYNDYTNRNNWVIEQKAKVPGYVNDLVAGDKYDDQENTIYKRTGMYSDDLFHGVKGYDTKAFTDERKSTSVGILTGGTYKKTDAITNYIVKPGIQFLKDSGATKKSINNINNDLKDIPIVEIIKGKKVITGYEESVFKKDSAYDSAYKYMASDTATKESAAMFIFGMGLHPVQDVSAHGNIANANEHTKFNDNPTVDSWDYNEKGILVATSGTTRLEQCEADTRKYISDYLSDYGSYLFTPSKYAEKK